VNPLEVDDMIGKLGLPEILLILAIALLIFGPSKLADLGKGLGEGIKNFKSAVKDGEEGDEKKKS
jgi:sec-independent protein translocase protein TatA